jgi:hypothetical protein
VTKVVVMLIICWMPQKDGTLKEIWRIEKTVTAEHCLTMNQLSGGGKVAAITVKCAMPREGWQP